jgi:hypothetical protein
MRNYVVTGNFVCCSCSRWLAEGHAGPHLRTDDQPK